MWLQVNYWHNMNQLSKKDLSKKKGNKEIGHLERRYWCDCKVKNYRKWLGVKKFGHKKINEW